MSTDIADYSELTCTNLMLKLKIVTKKLESGTAIDFFTNREQYDNIKKPFSKKHFQFYAKKVDDNKYHCQISKN